MTAARPMLARDRVMLAGDAVGYVVVAAQGAGMPVDAVEMLAAMVLAAMHLPLRDARRALRERGVGIDQWYEYWRSGGDDPAAA